MDARQELTRYREAMAGLAGLVRCSVLCVLCQGRLYSPVVDLCRTRHTYVWMYSRVQYSLCSVYSSTSCRQSGIQSMLLVFVTLLSLCVVRMAALLYSTYSYSTQPAS